MIKKFLTKNILLSYVEQIELLHNLLIINYIINNEVDFLNFLKTIAMVLVTQW